MRQAGWLLLALVLLLPACGKQGGEVSTQSPAPVVSVPEQGVSEAPVVTESAPEAAPPPVAAVEKPAPIVEPVKPAGKPAAAALSHDEGLALAQHSGCLACHKIETKLVGPAWQDVSKKYKGDGEARSKLVAKVKAGGKGNWTEVTGGMPMPPYSPRVPDEDIERLVIFVLSL